MTSALGPLAKSLLICEAQTASVALYPAKASQSPEPFDDRLARETVPRRKVTLSHGYEHLTDSVFRGAVAISEIDDGATESAERIAGTELELTTRSHPQALGNEVKQLEPDAWILLYDGPEALDGDHQQLTFLKGTGVRGAGSSVDRGELSENGPGVEDVQDLQDDLRQALAK